VTEQIALGFIHPGEVSSTFTETVIDLYASNLPILYPPIAIQGGIHVDRSRNEVVGRFLETTEADWLLFIDADMGISANGIASMWRCSDADEKPVVGALTFKLQPESFSAASKALHYSTLPVIYQWGTDTNGKVGYIPEKSYTKDAVYEVDGTGAACLLIHRRAFEAVGEDPFHPLTEGDWPLMSEDLSFCRRLNHAGIPIHVNTAAKTSHAKTFYVDELFHIHHQPRTGRPDNVVTGTPRCGADLAAQGLTLMGISCGLEKIYTADGIKKDPDLECDASWMAVTDVTPKQRVIHLTRDPFEVINDLADMQFMRHNKFAAKHSPQLSGRSDLEQAINFYQDWMRRLRTIPNTAVVKVEEFWDRARDICDWFQIDVPDDRIDFARQHAETDWGDSCATFSWSEIVDTGGTGLDKIRHELGYQTREVSSA